MWSDALFMDGLIIIAIILYFMGLFRFSRDVQSLFTSIEYSMQAFARWLLLFFFMLSMLAVSNISLHCM